jgi:hypothetical protein
MMSISQIPAFLRILTVHVAAVIDVYSRMLLGVRVFLKEPTAEEMIALLNETIAKHGAPRHFVSDQGSQSRDDGFKANLKRQGIRQRYGAVGKTGSIAILERFWRTLKETRRFETLPPLVPSDLQRRLDLALTWYAYPAASSRPRRRDASRGLLRNPPAASLRCSRPARRAKSFPACERRSRTVRRCYRSCSRRPRSSVRRVSSRHPDSGAPTTTSPNLMRPAATARPSDPRRSCQGQWQFPLVTYRAAHETLRELMAAAVGERAGLRIGMVGVVQAFGGRTVAALASPDNRGHIGARRHCGPDPTKVT